MRIIAFIFRDLNVDRLHFRRVKPTVFATAEALGSICAASGGGLNTLDRLELRQARHAAVKAGWTAIGNVDANAIWLQFLLHPAHGSSPRSATWLIPNQFLTMADKRTACTGKRQLEGC
jgi:hypothetical protein